MNRHLNWGRSDPVFSDSARKPDLANGCVQTQYFWHVEIMLFSCFSWRHTSCNQLEINTIQTLLSMSESEMNDYILVDSNKSEGYLAKMCLAEFILIW